MNPKQMFRKDPGIRSISDVFVTCFERIFDVKTHRIITNTFISTITVFETLQIVLNLISRVLKILVLIVVLAEAS